MYPSIDFTASFGVFGLLFLADNEIVLRTDGYNNKHHTQIGATEFILDMRLMKNAQGWIISKNESTKKKQWSIYNNLPKTVNAKLEEEVLALAPTLERDFKKLLIEGQRVTQTNIKERAEREIKELKAKLEEQEDIAFAATLKLNELEKEAQ